MTRVQQFFRSLGLATHEKIIERLKELIGDDQKVKDIIDGKQALGESVIAKIATEFKLEKSLLLFLAATDEQNIPGKPKTKRERQESANTQGSLPGTRTDGIRRPSFMD